MFVVMIEVQKKVRSVETFHSRIDALDCLNGIYSECVGDNDTNDKREDFEGDDQFTTKTENGLVSAWIDNE